ncbi:MAG TPA: PaaX family transcriptional regulator C-terminal domain-containing protein, partial [Patescibacteria group bacterium]
MTRTSDLSLFHKILVLTEDKGEIVLDDLKQFGSTRQTLGALGRLEGLKLIERTKEEKRNVFTLTEKGDLVLADILGHLPDSEKNWDGKWRIILFDIPESKRTVRQMFRIKLLDFGARMLQSSVWITPNKSVADKFYDLIMQTEFAHTVQFFEAKHFGNNAIDVLSLWQLDKLDKEYRELFKELDTQLKNLKKQKDISFTAKCMIVSLALVAKKDPHLPVELMPKKWAGLEAEAWYKKIRP